MRILRTSSWNVKSLDSPQHILKWNRTFMTVAARINPVPNIKPLTTCNAVLIEFFLFVAWYVGVEEQGVCMSPDSFLSHSSARTR